MCVACASWHSSEPFKGSRAEAAARLERPTERTSKTCPFLVQILRRRLAPPSVRGCLRQRGSARKATVALLLASSVIYYFASALASNAHCAVPGAAGMSSLIAASNALESRSSQCSKQVACAGGGHDTRVMHVAYLNHTQDVVGVHADMADARHSRAEDAATQTRLASQLMKSSARIVLPCHLGDLDAVDLYRLTKIELQDLAALFDLSVAGVL